MDKCYLPIDPPEPIEADFVWSDERIKAEQAAHERLLERFEKLQELGYSKTFAQYAATQKEV